MRRQVERYKFKLMCNGDERWVSPIYDSLRKITEKESDEVYFRTKVEGTLKFVNDDFGFIMSQNIYHRINVEVWKDESLYYQGYFRKKDCEVDMNHKILTTSISPNDQYSTLLAGMDNEYNLRDLGCSKYPVKVKLHPLLQILQLPNGPTSSTETYELINMLDYRLTYRNEDMTGYSYAVARTALFVHVASLRFELSGLTGSLSGANGLYEGDFIFYEFSMSVGGNDSILVLKSGGGVVTWAMRIAWHYGTGATGATGWDIALQKWDNGHWDTKSDWVQIAWDRSFESLLNCDNINYRMTSDGTNIGWAMFNCSYNVLRHLYYNKNSASSHLEDMKTFCWFNDSLNVYNNTEEFIPSIPMSAAEGFGYLADGVVVIASKRSTTTPNEYGSYKDRTTGELRYYLPPDDTVDRYYAVSSPNWTNEGLSWWVDVTMVPNPHYDYMVRKIDWYSLGEVIQKVVKKIDPTIDFQETTSYSEFLFSSVNPVYDSGIHDCKHLIGSKANIIAGNYNYPTWQMPITLAYLTNFLRNAFNCYWYVDSYKKLHIEHIKYFLNGKSYTNNLYDGQVCDLREFKDSRNNKQLSFLTNHWTYSDGDTPSRIEFSWMDKTSVFFDGDPIEIVHKVGDDSTTDRSVTRFSTDIDYLQLYGAGYASNEGFVCIEASFDGDYWASVEMPNESGQLTQNGLMSFHWLHERFMGYDIPTDLVLINKVEHAITYTTKLRENTVSISPIMPNYTPPAGFDIWGEPDPYTLFVSEVGRGIPVRIETDMRSDKITITLQYDNDN